MRASANTAVRCLRGNSQPIVANQSGIEPVIMNMSEMKARGMTMPLLTATVSSMDGRAMASARPRALKQADARRRVTRIARTERLGICRS